MMQILLDPAYIRIYTTDMTNTADTKAALLSKLTDKQLIEGRIALDVKQGTTPEENMTGAWLAEELERRYPELTDTLDSYFESEEALTMTYGEILAEVYGPVIA